MSVHEGNKYCGVIECQHKRVFLLGSREKRGRNLWSCCKPVPASATCISISSLHLLHPPEWRKINKMYPILVVNIIKQAKKGPKILSEMEILGLSIRGTTLVIRKKKHAGQRHSGETHRCRACAFYLHLILCCILCLSQMPYVSLLPWLSVLRPAWGTHLPTQTLCVILVLIS